MSKKKNRVSPPVRETAVERRRAYRDSQKNIKELNKPRKAPPTSFKALYDGGECPRCFKKIEKGETVHYNSDDVIVHSRHTVVEQTYTICPNCYLALPCMCDE